MCTSPKAPWLIFLICFVLASPPQVQAKSSSRVVAASPWLSGGSTSMPVSPRPPTVKVYSFARFVLDRAPVTFSGNSNQRRAKDTQTGGQRTLSMPSRLPITRSQVVRWYTPNPPPPPNSIWPLMQQLVSNPWRFASLIFRNLSGAIYF